MRLVVRWELTRSVSLPSEAHVEAGSSLPAGGVFEEGGGGGGGGGRRSAGGQAGARAGWAGEVDIIMGAPGLHVRSTGTLR